MVINVLTGINGFQDIVICGATGDIIIYKLVFCTSNPAPCSRDETRNFFIWRGYICVACYVKSGVVDFGSSLPFEQYRIFLCCRGETHQVDSSLDPIMNQKQKKM